ncbi:hypothetical protein K437DRAFT_257416 [Tilletiaria anomala UBC 951]|uniref:F-box domain-containing protein n=1 Tax=Tilletiaria anomala (strain ATCC 24038 / CBS 436.72 / UBC 951) TaxID=1037660 RepID=A0A066VQD1_TILAU|nr:uncharacterized protein K437DRAFT_257416 [Tilletiaria anomala UBC 951]KDN43686.1 hypothetical protein K437DRAFT_257416 [Tilletiaria anomala UBC 951]
MASSCSSWRQIFPSGVPKARSRSFSLLNSLPVDLQIHLLSFLWIKSITKTLARVNRYWAYLVDDYVRNRILYHVKQSGSQESRGTAEVLDRWFNVQLLFEAQRPIDTTSIKHTLYFSHFSITNSLPAPTSCGRMATVPEFASSSGGSRGVYTTLANFSFVQPAVDARFASQELPPFTPLSPMLSTSHGSFRSKFHTLGTDGIVNAEQPAAAGSVYNLSSEPAQRTRPVEHLSSIIDTNANTLPVYNRKISSSSGCSVSTDGNGSLQESRRGRSDSVRDNGFIIVSGPLFMQDESRTENQISTTMTTNTSITSSTTITTPTSSCPPAAFETAPFPFLQSTFGTRAAATAPARSSMRARAASAASSDGRLASPPRYRHTLGASFGQGIEAYGSALDIPASSAASMDMSRAFFQSRSRSGSGATAGTMSPLREQHKQQRKIPRRLKPAYAFQLDPLDSFETWILTLSIHRTDYDLTPPFVLARAKLAQDFDGGQADGNNAPPFAFNQPFWTERRMVEGLERVYREWFRPPNGCSPDIDSLLSSDKHDTRLSASASSPTGNDNHKTPSSARLRARLYQMDMTEEERAEILPPLRMLEVDNKPSCTLSIQPHPCEKFTEHPALSGSSGSHSWLSYSSFGAQYGPGSGMGFTAAGGPGGYSYGSGSGSYASLGWAGGADKVEFTFHCEEMRINAARLFSALEVLEQELAIKKHQARTQAARATAAAAATAQAAGQAGKGGTGGAISPEEWALMRLSGPRSLCRRFLDAPMDGDTVIVSTGFLFNP